MRPLLDSVFVGQPKVLTDERGDWTSSIFRDRVEGPSPLLARGLQGDAVARPYHGSPGAAVCVHLCDHYEFWRDRHGMALRAGDVGENFTVRNLLEDEVCVGDVVRVGSAVLQVSGPRVPCANQARRIGRSDWVRLTITENRTGFYMRVLRQGVVQAGDAWSLDERWNAGGAITALNRCMYLDFDPVAARDFAAMRGLEDWWKKQFLDKISASNHWTATLANGGKAVTNSW